MFKIIQEKTKKKKYKKKIIQETEERMYYKIGYCEIKSGFVKGPNKTSGEDKVKIKTQQISKQEI